MDVVGTVSGSNRVYEGASPIAQLGLYDSSILCGPPNLPVEGVPQLFEALWRQGHFLDSLPQNPRINDLLSKGICNEAIVLLPTSRQGRRLSADTMGVVAMGVVEHASLAKNPVNLVDLITTMQRIDICLWRKQELPGGLRVLAQNCLASYNHNLLIAGDICRGSDDVL